MDKRSSFRLEDQLLQESPINKNSLKKTRPVPKRKRFQNLIKSFIGRGKQQTIDSPTVDITDATATTTIALEPQAKIENDGINKTIERQNIYENNGSNIQLCDNQKLTESTLSLVTVQQKLWNVVPLLKRENNRQNSINGKSNSVVKYTSMRKCETVLALTRQFSTYSYIPEDVEIENYKSPGTFYKRSISLNVPELKHFHNIEPIQPLNRLRSCKSITSNTNCSRCSSILSESQSQSSIKNEAQENDSSERRFSNFESINKINYIPRTDSEEIHQLRRTSIKSNRNSSEKDYVDGKTEINPDQLFICKLCLTETDSKTDATKINYCGCNFCTECMKYYVEFEIKEGAYEISCPDAQCPLEGVLNLTEISALVPADIMEKHHRYRFNREVELDKFRTWCPRAGCETVCLISPQSTSTTTNCKTMIPGSSSSTKCNKSNESIIPYAVQCPTCQEEFCPECRKPWHQNLSCEEYRKRLVEEGLLEEISDFPYESDSIKFCPMCGVPIEKDSGCAQMMCKRCKHVFCWYCLASLDDDFLLRHYDTGPCKNKLGHSRASVIWHRAQVIGIFAGFGMLLVIASPLLLLAVPCILCCKCQPCCNGESKTEDADNDFDEVPLGR